MWRGEELHDKLADKLVDALNLVDGLSDVKSQVTRSSHSVDIATVFDRQANSALLNLGIIC